MASSAEQETRLCGNCKRDIPTVNFTMHEVHCRRNICVCDLCKEPVHRSDLEDHHATEHASVTCKCNMTMEKCAMEEHEKAACPLRLVKCQFCELEVTCNTLGNHEDYCGARTEPCDKCGSSVMIKDLQDHPTVCGKVKPQKKPMRVHSWASNRSYELPLHSAPRSSTFTDRLHSEIKRNVPKRFYGKSILTPEFGDLNQNPRREQNLGREQSNLDLDQDIPLDYLLREHSNAFSNDDFHFQSRQNDTRASPERYSPSSENNQQFWHNFYCKDNNMKTNVRGRSNLNYFSSNESVHVNSPSTPSADSTQLPCEFCEKLFPEDDLILHQSACGPGAPSSVRRRSPSPLLDFTESLRSSSPPAHNPVMIPCEFCGVLMEGDILFHHQDQCDMGQNSEKTTPFVDVTQDVSAEDVYRRYRAPIAVQAPGSDGAMYSRNQTRGNAGVAPRIDGLSRQNNTRRSYHDEMRKWNMEENARMIRDDGSLAHWGASSRDAGTRSKPKKMNTRPDEVDTEE
ncbi:TRAF-type zinc finger domain-containing protein 1 isoform X2 [Dendrobates tinctorius]|uniref:TRAF-type zinc finger domain-containing protein 1 isoform X2 n=1 Tax=Dendrobates tinctorius TaxID=92724 RepID=UPI003CC9CEC3